MSYWIYYGYKLVVWHNCLKYSFSLCKLIVLVVVFMRNKNICFKCNILLLQQCPLLHICHVGRQFVNLPKMIFSNFFRIKKPTEANVKNNIFFNANITVWVLRGKLQRTVRVMVFGDSHLCRMNPFIDLLVMG